LKLKNKKITTKEVINTIKELIGQPGSVIPVQISPLGENKD